MFEMDVPYDRKRLRVRLPELNVAGVLAGRQGDYEPDTEQEGLIERRSTARTEPRVWTSSAAASAIS